MPANLCFLPTRLYEYLDMTDGGISEWILPAIFTKHISKVWWIRPSWSHQIPDGCHDVIVGSYTPTDGEHYDDQLPFDDSNIVTAIQTTEQLPPLDLSDSSRLRVFSNLQYYVEGMLHFFFNFYLLFVYLLCPSYIFFSSSFLISM
jgi:hypothetical protein